MSKLTKAVVATALGLVMGASLCVPGAFAQSVHQNMNQSATSQTIVAQVANSVGVALQGSHVRNGYGNGYAHNGYGNNNGRGRYTRHVRCVRVIKWVRVHHRMQRQWVRVCRRY